MREIIIGLAEKIVGFLVHNGNETNKIVLNNIPTILIYNKKFQSKYWTKDVICYKNLTI